MGVPTQPKPFWKSTTIWLNTLAVAALVLQMGLNQAIVPVQYQELALAILNLINRFRTSQPVTLS